MKKFISGHQNKEISGKVKGMTMKKNRNNRIYLITSSILSGVMLLSNLAQAQENEELEVRIEEVIVTAEKREQNLQDVPVAISAFTADMLEARGIENPVDIQYAVPGLVIGKTVLGAAQVTLRGVGNENTTPGGDPGVPVHINGHYAQAPSYVLRDMVDIERVEVQRGPQGTLYGRNAIGGNINIITKRPTSEFEGLVGLDIGNYSNREVQAVISGPLGKKMRGRVVVVDSEHDGYLKNTGGSDLKSSDYNSFRGSLEYDLSETVQALLTGYHYKDEGSDTILQRPTDPDPRKVSLNTASDDEDESQGLSLDISLGADSFEFRSLTSFDDSVKKSTRDNDRTEVGTQIFETGMDYQTFTQELQLISTGNSKLKWVVGLYYYKEESDYTYSVSDTNNPVLYRIFSTLEADSQALYGQIDYALNDKTDFVLGLRYTLDDKSMDRSLEFIGFDGSTVIPFTVTETDESWSEVTGKVGLSYRIKEDVMFYGSWSRGYKAGGFNAGVPDEVSYDPEFVYAYEIGLKSQWLEKKLQLNLAAFYYDYNDRQELQSILLAGSPAVSITNSGVVNTIGVEAEFRANITSGLSIDGTLGFLNSEYEKFSSFDSLNPEFGVQDLSGNKTTYSPEWKFNVGIQYELPLNQSIGAITARIDYAWIDEVYYNFLNRGENDTPYSHLLPSYHHSNAQVRWQSSMFSI